MILCNCFGLEWLLIKLRGTIANFISIKTLDSLWQISSQSSGGRVQSKRPHLKSKIRQEQMILLLLFELPWDLLRPLSVRVLAQLGGCRRDASGSGGVRKVSPTRSWVETASAHHTRPPLTSLDDEIHTISAAISVNLEKNWCRCSVQTSNLVPEEPETQPQLITVHSGKENVINQSKMRHFLTDVLWIPWGLWGYTYFELTHTIKFRFGCYSIIMQHLETLMSQLEKTKAPMVVLEGSEGGGGRRTVHLFK